jgi:hypothetical protein
VSGRGGQTTTLVVGQQPLELEPHRFLHPRLPGGDGAMGGMLIQRGREVVGGVALINAPGFPYALTFDPWSRERLVLPKGSYRVTLLGTAQQTAQARIKSGSPRRTLQAAGPPRPITRSFSGGGSPLHEWAQRLGDLRAGDTLLLGAGAAGGPEVHATQTCLQFGDTASAGPCLTPQDAGFHTFGGASHETTATTMLTDQGPMVYSGQIQTAGLETSAGHVAMVVTPRF